MVAYELASGDLHVFSAKAVILATADGQGLQAHLERAHPHRRRHGPGLPARASAGDMESTVSPDQGLHRLGSCCRRRLAVRAASCVTRTASPSWSATPPPSRPRGARHVPRNPYRVRQGRGCGPKADHVYSTYAPAARQSMPAAGHRRIRPHLCRGRALTPIRCRCTRPRTTRWAGFPPRSTPRCLHDDDHIVPAFMPPVRSPACGARG